MNQKVYKKGDYLFREGDKITSIVFVQTGGVSICLSRGKKNIDLFQLGSQSVLGEIFFSSQNSHIYSAIATTETKTLEVPVDSIKTQFEAGPQLFKMTIKSLSDRFKMAFTEIKSSKLEKDSSPCPEDQVAKVFGSIFHTLNHKAIASKEFKFELDWNQFKQYSQRVFGESLKRLEQACNILVKLKLAHYQMGLSQENPDGPEEILKIQTQSLEPIEGFFEFYQYYYFKYGKNDVLKPDELTSQLLEAFIAQAKQVEKDKFGIVSLDFLKVQEFIKTEYGIQLNNDHFARLEQKGVMTKRRTISSNVRLEFEIKELENILFSWKIIKEIDKWNERGFVDINETETKKEKKSDNQCPQCSAPTQSNQKFCSECGHPLTAQNNRAA